MFFSDSRHIYLFFEGAEIQINSVRYAQHLSITFFIEEETGWKEKTLESLLESKEINPVNPKGNQSCILTRRTDAEAEGPTL